MKIKLKYRTAKDGGNFYNFYRDGITQSMIADWLECPRKAYLRYIQGWTPYKQSDALLFGNIVHHVLEYFYTSGSMPLAGTIKSKIKEYEGILYNNYKNLPSLNQQEKNELIFGQAEAILINYFLYYEADFNHNWLFQEKVFKIPYSNFGTYLCGKIDGALFITNEKTGKEELWLIDHKTYSKDNIEELLYCLPGDLQVWFYLYCSLYIKELNGITPCGFIYNRIRRPQLKLTQKDGTIENYVDRVYQDTCKRITWYYDRIYIRINKNEILNWEKKQLKPIIKNIVKWIDSNYTWPGYYNPMALTNKYGLSSYAKAIVSNNFDGLYQRDKVFQEL